jgi:hypothetical protein
MRTTDLKIVNEDVYGSFSKGDDNGKERRDYNRLNTGAKVELNKK